MRCLSPRSTRLIASPLSRAATMPSRPGLGIRKLMAQRRLSDEDINDYELKRADTIVVPVHVMDTDQDGDGIADVTNRRFYRKRRAPSPTIVMSSLIHSNNLRPLPPLPNQTPRTSVGSPNKCERHTECDCPLVNGKRGSPLHSRQQDERNENCTLVSCVNTRSPDDTLTYRIPKSRFYLYNDPLSKSEAVLSLSSEEEYKDKMFKGQQFDEYFSQELSEDGQQFMQETEDAFKAIGRTLSEVHVDQTPLVSNVTKPSSFDTPCDLDTTPPIPPPKETSQKSHSRSPSRMALILPGISSSGLSKNPSSASKPKKQKPKALKQTRSMKQPRKPAAPKQAVKIGPVWTLTENVSELLTGKLFHRTEADEMLTPDQIQEYKRRRITKSSPKESAEASQDSSLDILTEPSRHGDLPTDIWSADITSGESSTIPSSGDLLPRKSLHKRQQQRTQRDRPELHHNNTLTTSVSRPLKPTIQRAMTELPTIPESIPASGPDSRLSYKKNHESINSVSTTDYVFLPSSPRSVMTPRFRHGPIRISKSDLMPNVRLGGDDVLDWTAFQMAILGGAGDWVPNDEDTHCEREEEVDDIVEWWESWHFESIGDLITRDYEAASPTSTLSGEEIPDLSYSEIDSDNASPSYRWQDAQRATPTPNLRLDVDFEKRTTYTPYYFSDRLMNANQPWHQEGDSMTMASCDSVNSLPPSPMLDLRVTRSETGDDLDVVPMGYNLGHDLGDFLKWESEHTYAGFTSPTRTVKYADL
ncbi:hypothetical protein GGS21DRAFT_530132 [Xylaria nigripes]|nr:hypothetical protein GGS21DRAFT_530132 [Xylaria nigripes]